MEGSASTDELELIKKYLGTEGVIVDPKYKGSFVLKETQAQRRKELVSDIVYNFALGIKKGDYYVGQAEIKFYLNEVPKDDEELFINS